MQLRKRLEFMLRATVDWWVRAVVRALQLKGHSTLVLRHIVNSISRIRSPFESFFRPNARRRSSWRAARVGGIHANNSRPALFIRDNLLIQTMPSMPLHRSGVATIRLLGIELHLSQTRSSAHQGGSLLTGPLEPTNEWYAIAKIAGVKMCQAYRREFGFNAMSLMPTNLYGPRRPILICRNSHVLAGADPALPRSQGPWGRERDGVGHRYAAP